MVYRIILFVIFICALAQAQDKHFIYFKNKGISPGAGLNKTDKLYSEAIADLTERAIERRIKNMGDDFITYEDIPINRDYISAITSYGIQIIHELKWFNSVSVRLNEEQIGLVKNLDFVDRIERVKSLSFSKPFTNEPILNKYQAISDYGQSFTQLNLSDIPLVHSKGITGENVIVGLLDTGFDWERHISLKNQNIVGEYDFIFNDSITANQPGDHPQQHNHGTYVLSVIGGYHDSVMIGAAYNAKFLLAKTEDITSETRIEEDNYAAALIWMEALGVDVTSSSLGYSEFDTAGDSYTYNDMDGNTTIVTKAAELAFLRGISTITSAGNEGNTPWRYITAPADGRNIIAVGAVNSNNQLVSFSSRGPTADGRIKPEVVAMGSGVFGAAAGTDNNYASASGTSSSAPIASGVAALMLSIHPHLKNTQVRSIILESSDNALNPNNDIGYGLISAKNAIEFPNLEYINNNYALRKIFFDESILLNSVKMHYSTDGENFVELQPIIDRLFRYTFNIPALPFDKNVQFYFSYIDSTNSVLRDPVDRDYTFRYGSLDISLYIPLKNVLGNEVVSNPYPNPFLPSNHNSVRVDYKSPGNELFKLTIIDGTGQKVKQLSQVSETGLNFIEWNGVSDQGYLCSSGVYYLLIQLAGNEYGRKLILLK
ncbi:MAG: S8 family peptidase [Ignavibacteriaceae bacterium]